MTQIVTLPPSDPPDADGARTAGWWQAGDNGHVLCNLCPRHCRIAPGRRGFCFVRENRGGRLVSTTYGRSTGFCVDPIEKKPLFQFYPGSAVLSFGTAGCNLGCRFCQNWTMSRNRSITAASELAQPETVAHAARQLGCRSVAFTYNDPIIWAEYAIDTAHACHDAGIKTVAVSSGYITEQARSEFYRHMDAANVDLKGFSEAFYHDYCGGQLAPVLDTLRYLARETDVWLEITNLIIPEANDSLEEIERMCQWIVRELGPDVPLHFTAFHPDFQVTDRGATPRETLLAAYGIARRAGLHYVYTGNIHDPEHQSTFCPGCGQLVIGRRGYLLSPYEMREDRCGACGAPIAGHYAAKPGNWGSRCQPVRIANFAVPSNPRETSPRKVESMFSRTSRPEFNSDQHKAILQAAARHVCAAVRGDRDEPGKQLPAEVGNTPVYGAFVSLKRAGKLRSCCGCLGDAMPLAQAVDRAAERAALDDPRFPPITTDELDQLDVEVWILWQPEPVLERGEARIGAVEIGRHGVQIARGAARGLLLPGVAVEHRLDAEAFLRQVCLKAGLPGDAWKQDDTELMTFEGYAVRGKMAHLRYSSPEGCAATGPVDIRPPAVAGKFYPGEPAAIEAMLDDLLPQGVEPADWPAAMIPHAGWIYSGRVAGATLARVHVPPQVILFCPRHTRPGAPWAVAPCQAWGLPGRTVDADPELAARLAREITGLELDADAHRQEHAIEVHLPLLARLRSDARVVGVALGGGDLPQLQQFGRQLAAVIAQLDPRPLLLISSDMNHFADDRHTRTVDRMALDAMQSLDPALLYRTVRDQRISMCGVTSAVVVMEALRTLGSLNKMEEVGYATSADAGGGTANVVGYAGVLFG